MASKTVSTKLSSRSISKVSCNSASGKTGQRNYFWIHHTICRLADSGKEFRPN